MLSSCVVHRTSYLIEIVSNKLFLLVSLLVLIVSFAADAQTLNEGEECGTQYDSITNKAKGHHALLNLDSTKRTIQKRIDGIRSEVMQHSGDEVEANSFKSFGEQRSSEFIDAGLRKTPGTDALTETNIPNLPTDLTDSAIPELTEGMKSAVPLETGGIDKLENVTGEVKQYSEELKTVTEQGVVSSDKIEEVVTDQVGKVDEIAELQSQQGLSKAELAKYQLALEKYKDEQRIKAELLEKSKDIATDVVAKNKPSVGATMQKLAKVKRKFSDVPDIRKLPKHAPNPMQGLPLRERILPGLTFQLLTGTATWLELDPQVYYRLNGKLSAGIGGMYRFSMNRDNFTFSDFGNMYGGKIFAQYHAFKGFFVHAEGQQVIWNSWDLRGIDPGYVDRVYVAAAGIGKDYSIAPMLKGNIQVLYHHHWSGSDPYRPKIMIRLGFDLSLKKKEEKPWEKILKEFKKRQKAEKESLRTHYKGKVQKGKANLINDIPNPLKP